MRKPILLILLFVVLLVTPTAVRYAQFYRPNAVERPEPPSYAPDAIAAVPTPATSSFVDEPTTARKNSQGLVLLDQAHGNQFTLDDVSYLDGRLAARGFDLVSYTGGDLARQLRPVTAFITITPLEAFSDEEIQAVRRFVARGGHLLLVGDPTRFQVVFDENDPFTFTFDLAMDEIPLNSLANEFDLIFNGDYLYNTVENEGNFRNIILRQEGLAEGWLTEEISQLAFYSAHSLQVGAQARPLLTADDNTWSSATDRPGELVLAATSQDGRVLALGDVHFLTEPYYTVFDNGRFIAHIADFLTTSPEQRDLALADFPYFYRQPVNLVYLGDPELGVGAFDEIIALQDAFSRIDIPLSLADAPQTNHDVLYLGLYNQADEVADLLASAGVTLTIQPPILPNGESEAERDADNDEVTDEDEADNEEETAVRLIQSDLGNVHMSGTALIALDESNGRRSLIVLAASKQGLENIVSNMLNLIPRNADIPLASCLIQDPLALCPTGMTDEEVEAELITTQLNGSQPPSEPDESDTPPIGNGATLDELGADLQGAIGLGDTIEGTLEATQAHAWQFTDGPAVIDITLTVEEGMDGILELYDADNQLLERQDATFSGETETLLGIDIPDDDAYTIVVRDYFEEGGSYTLSVTEGDPDGAGDAPVGEGIFLYVEDDGVPLNGGVTSYETLLAWLEPTYNVTLWQASADGPLQEGMLDGYALIIWDTGDYQSADGFFDEDVFIILDYLDGGGALFVTGSAPALFSELALGVLRDVEVTGDDPILTNGLTPGDVLALDQPYDAIISDVIGDTLDEASPAFLLRGPESETPQAVTAFGVVEESFNQRTVFVLFPFVALPADVQETLLGNIMTWFGMGVD
jgi:hypothetical protein